MKQSRVIGTSSIEIYATERQLGFVLPKSFSTWLLENNGRSLGALTIFPVFDVREPRKTWDSIVRQYKGSWREWRNNVSDTELNLTQLLPFAAFGAGDYYCFDYGQIDSAGEPAVVLWSHETGEAKKIAKDFSEFLVLPGRPA